MNDRDILRADQIAPEAGEPPRAQRKPTDRSFHGRRLDDPYHWLRDPDYPEVETAEILNYLEAENRYFESVMAPWRQLTESLFEEMKGRIPTEESSVPVRDGNWLFWWRYSEGAEYREHLRKRLPDGPEELFLSEPALAHGHEYFRLGGMDISDDGTLLAFSTDTEGDERYLLSLRRMDLENTDQWTTLHEAIPDTIGDPIWLPETHSFCYLEVSEEWRPYRVRLHTVGRPAAEDPVLYEEKDSSFFVDVDLSQSRSYLVITTGDHETNEIRTLPVAALREWIENSQLPGTSADGAESTKPTPVTVVPRERGREAELDHHGEHFYLRINDTNKNFRILRAPVAAPEQQKWEEVIPPEQAVYLRGITCFADRLVLEERRNGIDEIRLVGYEGGETRIPFPEQAYTAELGENPEYDVETIRIRYQSMVTPPTVYDYDFAEGALRRRKVREIPSGYDPSRYTTRRLFVTARDGTEVPVSLVHLRNLETPAPFYLYGYGAYGHGITPHFSTKALSLLDRGFIVAIAHVRGGDELGYHWYEAGKGLSRMNTFNDYLDVAEFLLKEGYTKEGHIYGRGASAGGQLMGVVANQAPALFGGIVAEVPFVDALNTMLDESLPLTPIEWPEWGNPIEDRVAFDYIRSYSPYDNTTEQHYPPLFVTAGLSDPRVTYWEPAKWTARLREKKQDQNLLLLKTNMGAGHGGRSGRYGSLYEEAEVLTFLLLCERRGSSDETPRV